MEDNSELKQAIPKLTNGKDFLMWKRQLENWFYEHRLYEYVYDIKPRVDKPDFQSASRTDIKNFLEYKAFTAKAKGMICRCLDIKYLILIQDIDHVSDCWIKLDQHFMKDTGILQNQLEDDFDPFKLNFHI